jgi:hypothetical protein
VTMLTHARVCMYLLGVQVTFSESLSEWLDRDEARLFDMDDCRGFNCGCSAAKASTSSGLTTRSYR